MIGFYNLHIEVREMLGKCGFLDIAENRSSTLDFDSIRICHRDLRFAYLAIFGSNGDYYYELKFNDLTYTVYKPFQISENFLDMDLSRITLDGFRFRELLYRHFGEYIIVEERDEKINSII